MKTLLIDPHTQTISEVEYDGGLDAMYALLGCQMVEAVYCDDGGQPLFQSSDCLFVDEEGLLGNLNEQAFFTIHGKTIAGKAMTVGCNEDGETVAAVATSRDLEELGVCWVSLDELRDMYRNA